MGMELKSAARTSLAVKPATEPEAQPDPFEEIFRRYWDGLLRVIAGLLGDADEAEDTCLEAFARLHHNLPGLKSRHNLGAWLYRTALHLALNQLRSGQRRRRYEEEHGRQAHLHTPEANPALQAEANEARQQVRAILAEMKPRQARLLILRAAGLSYADLAETCEVAPGSIGSLLNRAEKEFARRYRHRYGEL